VHISAMTMRQGALCGKVSGKGITESADKGVSTMYMKHKSPTCGRFPDWETELGLTCTTD
jgi:hypothetical protein